jgi:tetratricopeptide (TPR) repeat protein
MQVSDTGSYLPGKKRMSSRIDLIKEMLLKEPEDVFLNYALALELEKKGEIQKAILILETVLKKDENYLAGYYQLGKFYEAISEKEKAIHIYTRGCGIASKQKNAKTLRELNEAINQLSA